MSNPTDQAVTEHKDVKIACQFLAAYKYCRTSAGALRECQAVRGADCRGQMRSFLQCEAGALSTLLAALPLISTCASASAPMPLLCSQKEACKLML